MAASEPLPELERCGWQSVLAALLALSGQRVELVVTAAACPWRQILAIDGVLETGPEIGTGEEAMIVASVGEGCLALKRGWLEQAWCGGLGPELALLFHGGVLVEIDPAGGADQASGPDGRDAAARERGGGGERQAEGRVVVRRGSSVVGASAGTRFDARRRR